MFSLGGQELALLAVIGLLLVGIILGAIYFLSSGGGRKDRED